MSPNNMENSQCLEILDHCYEEVPVVLNKFIKWEKFSVCRK